jgi:hypothetical protein
MTATTQQEETTEATTVILTRESEHQGMKEKDCNDHHQQQQEQESLLQERQNTIQDLLTRAQLLYQEDKLTQVSKLLNSIDSQYLTHEHHVMLQRAQEAEYLVKDLKARPQDGDWIDQGVSVGGGGGKFPTRILYRLEKSIENDRTSASQKVKLRARCETPIEKDLLEPLLSVLNETELYETWLPSFNVPRLKIRHCKKLKQCSRVSQILWVVMDLPWPMAAREVVLSAAAFDSIEDDGHIGIQLKTIHVDDIGDNNNDDLVPKVDDNNNDANANAVRVDLDGGFLFEKCPRDHPAMKEFLRNKEVDDEDVDEDDNDEKEDCILVTFSAIMDPHMKLLPQSFLNFLIKTALGTAWRMLLRIAQDVKDGKRPDHARAMEQKRQELYDYVRERVDVMLSTMKETTTTKKKSVVGDDSMENGGGDDLVVC